MTDPMAAPAGEHPDRPGHRTPALIVAVVSGFGVWVVHLLFVTSVAGRRVDEAAMRGADEVGGGPLWATAARVLDIVSVPFVAGVVIVTMALAFTRRRVALAVQVAVLVVGANVTTQVLKSVLVRPDLGLADRIVNSLPSGHTTVAASAAAALVLAVPRRFRAPAAVVGALYTTTTGVATLIVGWHRPADAVAAILVVLAWSGLVIAVGRKGTGFGRAGSVRGAAALLVGVGLVLAGLSGVAYIDVADRTTWDHAGYLMAASGGALAIAAFAFAAFGVLVGMVAAADPADG